MRKYGVIAVLIALCGPVQASWYWPFESEKEVDERPKRISELIEPASELIEEAADLAAEGKVDESVEKYRKALVELDRIEMENPDRVKSVEFATLRNKRAYVNAAIDSMLLSQVKSNAKAVAVSDTTELEKRLAEEKAAKSGKSPAKKAGEPAREKAEVKLETAEKKTDETANAAEEAKDDGGRAASAKPLTKREQAMVALAKSDFATAERLIGELLVEKPNGAAALNLKAAMEARQGKLKEAENTLDQAIQSNPRNHFAYYNMANLMLQVRADDKTVARRYYETGRALGGPVDARLEEALQ